jgi:SAM-dependent methyltransferase
MLTDPIEIEIISKAKQKNVRDPKRSRKHFENIFRDFFKNINFSNMNLLDQGPGQYDFGVLAKQKGAKEVYCIDIDKAVIELGLYKNFQVKECNIMNINFETFKILFDGIFNKFSMNCFWFKDKKEHSNFVGNIDKILKPSSWAWIGPWNGIPKIYEFDQYEVKKILDIQISEFKNIGFDVFELTNLQVKEYGIHGKVANNLIFIKNLNCSILNRFNKI